MTPAERNFWMRAQRRVAGLSPEVAAAILRAFAIIRDSLTDAELERIVRSGNVDQLFRTALTEAVLDRAFIPLRQRLRAGVETNFKYFARDLPKGGMVDGQIAVAFDVLNPRVVQAIRDLDTRVIDRLRTDVRDVVRAHVENGLRGGVNPRETARSLRTVIGLAPNQEEAVRNYRRALEGGDGARSPFAYQLRDRRFDATVKAGKLTPEKIDRMVGAYRKRFIAWNAETNARTASLDAMKAGQRLSWESAVDRGIVDRGRLTKRWVGVKDERERPEHLAMEGETVPFDARFSNGEMVPGDSTWNCRCIALYQQQPR